MDVLDPRGEYSRRLEAHLKVAAALDRRHIRVGNAKLAIIVAGIVVALLALYKGLISPYWILLPAGVFVALGVVHEHILRARTRAETAAASYRRGIARIDDKWPGTGASGERFRDPKHVYADDLDLFGRGCLFELLSTARLPMGEDRLAVWLCTASAQDEIIERRKIVAELRDKLDLREDIAVVGEDLRPRLDPRSLLSWAANKPVCTLALLRVVFVVLALAAFAALLYLLAGGGILPLAIVLAIELVFYSIWRRRAEQVMETLHCNAEGLVLFSQILERIEKEPFASPYLQAPTAALTRGERPASRAIRDFARIVYWIDGREGMLAKLADLPLLYSLQAAFAADAWRIRWGPEMRTWMETAGEVEALLSLASYSFEHPADPFPEFVAAEPVGPESSSWSDDTQTLPENRSFPTLPPIGSIPVFDGRELGHPLIPAAQCVRNNVCLDATTRVMLVSGSNMSGKSTLLRTVGINTVLAMAGAPVRAKSLRLTPVALGTRIRSGDSLQEGRSNFYTEILHIRSVFDLLNGNAPVLFLFDELLEGTNSKDRQIGAEGLLRALIERGAIGIVTTHDLALTSVTDSLGRVIRNFHFQDYVENGQMRFDYKLHEGVVAKSNAIELMRLVGLKV
jgi:MutS domain V